MRKPFLDDVGEIRSSPTLRCHGALLALIHPLTFLFFSRQNLPTMLSRTSDAICWPFFEDCKEIRPPLSEAFIQTYLRVYLAVGLLAAALFLVRRTVPVAYSLLVAANLLKLSVFVQDYRMMGNYHYMPFVSSLAFLLLPDKRRLSRYLLVGYYLSAGTLKVNYEWLSGMAIFRPSILSGKLLELACGYVVLLELVIVFGLLARPPWLFWVALAQFVAFHAFSWHIVGFFYPCVMACLLLMLVLDRLLPEDAPADDARTPSRWPLSPSTTAALSVYAAAQLAPYLFEGKVAITGEGRMFALNMFDAQAMCENLIVVHDGGAAVELSRPAAERLSVRIRCDPIVYFNWAKNLCDENRGRSGFDLDIFLISKRTTDPAYRPAMAITGFCSRDLSYDLLSPNPWIQK